MKKVTAKPQGDSLLIRPFDPVASALAQGLKLPDNYKAKRPTRGVVISAGPDARQDLVDVMVVFDELQPIPVKINKEALLILKADRVLLVLEVEEIPDPVNGADPNNPPATPKEKTDEPATRRA